MFFNFQSSAPRSLSAILLVCVFSSRCVEAVPINEYYLRSMFRQEFEEAKRHDRISTQTEFFLLAKSAETLTHKETNSSDSRELANSNNIFNRPRIIGGERVEAGEFPSYAWSRAPILCGGTIIHDDIILTAAHCDQAFVNGAFTSGININGADGAEFINHEKSIPHPNYNKNTFENDIMIVKLAAKSEAPKQTLNFDPAVPTDGSSVTVIGYGVTSFQGNVSNELLKVTVTSSSDAECEAKWGDDYFPNRTICAGLPAGGKDSCQGDSGGPLFTDSKVQVGVVSSGDDCAKPDTPALYTRVSGYKEWIQKTICDVSSFPPSDCKGKTTPPVPTTKTPTKTPARPVKPPAQTAPVNTNTMPQPTPTQAPISKPKPTGYAVPPATYKAIQDHLNKINNNNPFSTIIRGMHMSKRMRMMKRR